MDSAKSKLAALLRAAWLVALLYRLYPSMQLPQRTMTIKKVFQSLLGGEMVRTATATIRKLNGSSRAFANSDATL